MKVLFISRAFPPVIGGIEQQNQSIARALARRCKTDIIVNRFGKKLLPLFLPYATLRALVVAHRYDVVLLGDGVLAVIGAIIKQFSRKPVICIVHGLDLTFPNRIYQHFWLGRFLPSLNRLIAVGNATISQGTARGIPADRFTFIPNGVDKIASMPTCDRRKLGQRLSHPIPGGVLLTLGRLVKRKGVAWFIENVLPKLDSSLTYLVAGNGPEQVNIAATIQRLQLQDKVLMLGEVSAEDRELLFACADLFVQPNIPVAGDMEGFGLVVLEAAERGLPVVAANIEGLQDAISHGNNGYLVAAGDANAWQSRITTLLQDPDGLLQAGKLARSYVHAHYAWELIAARYEEILARVSTRQTDCR
jgi:glycosyltransferase involved in cell wall biosynthesis